eukprot:379111_1
MNSLQKVLVIGDLFLDIQANGVKHLPLWDEDCIVDNMELLPGGCASNTARQLSEFKNIGVDLLSVIGKDALSKVLLDLVKDEKCNFILNNKQSTSTNSCIVLSGKNSRSFVTNRNNLKYLNHKLVSLQLSNYKYDHIHIGGFYNCFGLHSIAFINVLIDCGYKYKISLDLQMSQLKLDRHKREIFIKLCSVVSILFINETELLELIGMKMNRVKAMNEFIKISGNNRIVIVMKLGSKGCLLRQINGKILQIYNKNIAVDIIDTTGAGDAFAAGFLSQYVGSNILNRTKWMNCLLYATASACLCVQREGACKKPVTYEKIHNFCDTLRDTNLRSESKL